MSHTQLSRWYFHIYKFQKGNDLPLSVNKPGFGKGTAKKLLSTQNTSKDLPQGNRAAYLVMKNPWFHENLFLSAQESPTHVPPSLPVEEKWKKKKKTEVRIFQMPESMAKKDLACGQGTGFPDLTLLLTIWATCPCPAVHPPLPTSRPREWGAAPLAPQTCSLWPQGWWISRWHLYASLGSDSCESPNLPNSPQGARQFPSEESQSKKL